ncbi:hypothetical protein K469DRAFT_731735 [Zopfia rhizophila CBS 207.26]|uniref:DUF676 domain-containing protein n=1 Tax=Zopfia rhizophila CBS 207.26 TaxID=1314779 RepID=A0A6A6DH49_9PEZI|nr:hypothetical protein K469DRAFT_731735 [Zopfia rhizophila CBS 207.26]
MRSITDKHLGLKVLYPKDNPQANIESAVDIVAVHGMGAHPDDTWCTLVNGRHINWLEEPNMLPEATPNARIMRYGYQSQWFGEGALGTKASTISQNLLLQLVMYREKDLKRPLIFVAHSFGGLVVLRGRIVRLAEERFRDRPLHVKSLNMLQAGGELPSDLIDDYLRVARESGKPPKITCFFERMQTDIGRILGETPDKVSVTK